MPRYLVFKKKEKHKEWLVMNKKGQHIGDLAFHEKWRKFAFYPDESPYEHDIYLCEMCLREIADFLHSINFAK